MRQICIGIHAHEQPEQLLATLESVRRNTASTVRLTILPDGPDPRLMQALRALSDIPQFGTEEPLGPPACFNRLAIATEANILILLESGAVVGPGWLDYLLAALDAEPHNGLAGPSTNHAWNEQGVFPGRGGTLAQVARTAQEVAQRFGTTWRTLEPLHSLADFCYVVRREVVQTIGAADEGYGLGPCWEMDYNIRAARAGFRGVWACGAYVHRAPFTARRRREEARRFTASKQRYQDKFCALQLHRLRPDYERHCQGETCEHFAPPTLIQIHLPLPTKPPPVTSTSALSPATTAVSSPTAPSVETLPLVSCVMPTRDRTAFVWQSIRYFERQNYPARELIILDDGAEDLSGQVPHDPRIRYVRLPRGQSIGAKRNLGCELARGSIIAQWDDDDWYAPGRLSAQVAPLLSGEADISGLTAGVFFELPDWRFWSCTPDLHHRLFVYDVHGDTLVYQRRIWEQLARYPDASLGEDAALLRQAIRRGARLCKLPNDDLFIYIRHEKNSWSFLSGQYLDTRGWQRVAEPMLPPADRVFYAALSPVAPPTTQGSASPHLMSAQPLVSCIMPTANRRLFVPQAIGYFLRQDYPNRELIVVDDGADAVADLIPPASPIRYMRLERKHTVGAKRNVACQEARGEIIVHWDDDDWMAHWRLSYQVASLLKQGADICGLDQMLYYDLGSGQSWQFIYAKRDRPWVAGNTLCYTKDLWRRNSFPDMNVGEDNHFLWSPQPKAILPLQDCTFYIALIHSGNTSPKRPAARQWHAYPTAEIRNLMGEDSTFYTALLQDKRRFVAG